MLPGAEIRSYDMTTKPAETVLLAEGKLVVAHFPPETQQLRLVEVLAKRLTLRPYAREGYWARYCANAAWN